MKEIIMGYQGEMSLKGLNRNQFEAAMMKILRYRLKTVGKFKVYCTQSTFYMEPEEEDIDSNTVNGLVQEKTCHLPKVGDRFTLGEYDGVVTRTAKRRVTEVRLTPAEKPDTKKDEEEKGHFGRITSK